MAMNKRTCKIDGCERPRRGRGWCSAHYSRWRRHGDPHIYGNRKIYMDPHEGFAARTEWRGDCLIWTGSKSGIGYGRFGHEGKDVYAHRWIWEQTHGPIPAGMMLDHVNHCDFACVNVDHLRLASMSENQRNRPGAQRNSSSGVRNVHRRGLRWVVSVKKDGKPYRFGTYQTVEEAAEVAEAARRELFGDFAGKG